MFFAVGVEEAADRHDPVASCQLRDVLCRFHTQRARSALPKALEKAAVVARDLDDQIALLEASTVCEVLREGRIVGADRLRRAADIDVLAEQHGRVHHIQKLHQAALHTDVDIEWVDQLLV
jgi:hypothetical protein